MNTCQHGVPLENDCAECEFGKYTNDDAIEILMKSLATIVAEYEKAGLPVRMRIRDDEIVLDIPQLKKEGV